MKDFVWVLRHPTTVVTKTWKIDGTITNYEDGKLFIGKEEPVSDIHSLSTLLTLLEDQPYCCVIRGKYKGQEHSVAVEPDETKKGRVLRRLSVHDDVPHHWILVDIDKFTPLTADALLEPVESINEFIETQLPGCFHGSSYHWQLSSSMGHPTKDVGTLRAHVWFWLKTPYTSNQLRMWARATDYKGDLSLFNPIQVHYTAAPIFEDGVSSPISERSGFVEGDFGDDVGLVISDDLLAAAPVGTSSQSRHQRINDTHSSDPIVSLLYEKKLVKSRRHDGGLNIVCPRTSEHTGDSTESSTLYYPAHTGGHKNGAFVCLHAHCTRIPQSLFLDALGYDDSVDVFDNLDEDDEIGTRRERTIPDPKHLCTDQANANRIVSNFKSKIMVVADRWYAWDGKRWKVDDAEVMIKGMHLSRMIHKEADYWRGRKAKSSDEKEKYIKIAESLETWAKKSEMAGTINAALNMTRKVLAVDAPYIDSHDWLLNVRNGTVDLRTGRLRPHDPDDLITKIIDIPYDPDAECPVWEEVLHRITHEADNETKPLAHFVRRWFGYCLTGSTREQKFVVHWGDGSNGKSTIIGTISDIMGEYAGTAAPALLMSADKSRHPTEIADLFGRRMVTAHESGEGGILREDFIKQATGSDKLKGRFMQKDFFEFDPVHKIQLLTNHKPTIKGQDEGIWRRVMLLPYTTKFGTEDEVRKGLANYVKDMKIAERLERERGGILTWLIAGCVEWFRDGLCPPDAVLAASRSYKNEQDRMLQFVDECCDLQPSNFCYLTNGNHEGIYPAYQRWCKIGGIFPLSKMNFLNGLGRVVPSFKKEDRLITVDGKRRKVTVLHGLSSPEYYEL